MNAVELRDVTKRFGSGPPALDGVSLSVAAGRVLVLLGRSGSGKTTALKLVNGLVRPDTGQVLHAGPGRGPGRRHRPAASHRVRHPGSGSAAPYDAWPENVGLVPELLGWGAERIASRTREMLDLVRLDPDRFGPKRPAELSGGERQRVGLARALGADPPLLLMDEPFGALDPLTRRQLQEEFREVQRRLGKTVLLVTHDVAEAMRLADEVAVMDGGRVLQRGAPREVLDSPAPGFVSDFLAASALP